MNISEKQQMRSASMASIPTNNGEKRLVVTFWLPLAILALAATTLLTMSTPASAGTLPTRHPTIVCARGDMDDGLIIWRYVTTQYGVNYYKYHLHEETAEGNGNCLDNPRLVSGKIDHITKKCIAYGVAATVGAVIPSIGVVESIFFASSGCFIEFV
jgi:hypothetical protein